MAVGLASEVFTQGSESRPLQGAVGSAVSPAQQTVNMGSTRGPSHEPVSTPLTQAEA